jgi:hypothetical protein
MPLKKKKAKKKPAKKRKVLRKVARKKKIIKKRPLKKAPLTKKIKATVIGTVTHYFPKVRAAVVKLKTGFSLGDAVRIKGHTTDFTQNVISMQIEHVPITKAKKGQEIGLLVNSRVRQHDIVYKA